MINGKRIVVVLPAYNAAQTLQQTWAEIPLDIVDEVLLTDDGSRDDTVQISRSLGIRTLVHARNMGYGANQKTCYRAALDAGADIVIMLHPDYQYTPRLATALASMIAYGVYDTVLGSRILGNGALSGGMPGTPAAAMPRTANGRVHMRSIIGVSAVTVAVASFLSRR